MQVDTQIYEGGIKTSATNDVKWQLKVGLAFLCIANLQSTLLLQIIKN